MLPISCFIDDDAFEHVSLSQENSETCAFLADRVGDGAASADDDVDKNDFLEHILVDLVGGSAALVMHESVHESMFPQVCTSEDVVLDGSCGVLAASVDNCSEELLDFTSLGNSIHGSECIDAVHDDSGHDKNDDLGLDAQLVVRGGDRALRIWSDLVTRAKCEQARQELWSAASFKALWQDRWSDGIDFDGDCDFLLLRSFAMIWFSRNNGILCIVSLRSTPSLLEPADVLRFNLYLACAGYLLATDFRAVLVCLGSACASGVLHARLLGASRNSI